MKHYKFTILLTILILIVILMPGGNVPEVKVEGFDKVVHLGMFGALTLCFYYEYNEYKGRLPHFIYTFLTVALFGLATEVMQLFADKRSFDLRDLLADSVGILLASIVFIIIQKKGTFS